MEAEIKGLKGIIDKLKDENSNFTYLQDPKGAVKKLELENGELKKEIGISKSILRRLERELSNYQDDEFSIDKLREKSHNLELENQQMDEELQELRLDKLTLQDRIEKGPFAKDVLSLILKNENISEQLRGELKTSKMSLKDYEYLSLVGVKN